MLVIGFIAGYIAEKAMNRDHGLLTNILVGIAGSFVGGTLAGLVNFNFYGFFGRDFDARPSYTGALRT